jgi:hypothetical protein
MNTKFNIIFIHDYFSIGGIEILEMKIIKELLDMGFNVTILCRKNTELNLIDKRCRIFIHGGYPDLISRALSLVNNKKNYILVSFHPNAAIVAEIIGDLLQKYSNNVLKVNHFHWVCHSRAFFFSNTLLGRFFFRKIFFMLPVKSTYFMNNAALNAHQSQWKHCLTAYPVLRIIGRRSTARNYIYKNKRSIKSNDCENKNLRIISVGRLVPFKSYNMSAALIVNQLLNNNIESYWDIWGYGPDEDSIILKCKEYNVTEYIKLRGTLSHDIFDETVSSYDLFVGMGTAVLESAKTCTPTIVGVENRGGASYGHLHEAPEDSVGDRVDGFPERSLCEVISTFASLDLGQRRRIGQLDALAAERRESTLEKFVEAILAAEPLSERGFSRRVMLTIGKVYLLATHWKREGINA